MKDQAKKHFRRAVDSLVPIFRDGGFKFGAAVEPFAVMFVSEESTAARLRRVTFAWTCTGMSVEQNSFLSLRFAEIERFVNRTTIGSDSELMDTETLFISTSRLKLQNGKVEDFDACVAESIARASSWLNSVKETGTTSLLAASDAAEILNENPSVACKYYPDPFGRACRGVASAFIAGRPDVAQLSDIYLKAMEGPQRAFYRNRFAKLLLAVGIVPPIV